MLTVEHLQAGYSQVPVVMDGDLRVDESEVVAVVGPNGAGKSTILKSVCGITRILGGDIRFDGRSLVGLRTDEVSRLGIGYVPQGHSVFRSLTVSENLKMGAYQAPRTTQHRLKVVLSLFPELVPLLRSPAGVLSGGERTMVSVARALMGEPRMLLLDEPSSGLAPKGVAALWEHLHRLRDTGISMLIVEQRTRDVLELADRGYVLVSGRTVLAATARQLLQEVNLGEIFLQHTKASTAQSGTIPAPAVRSNAKCD